MTAHTSSFSYSEHFLENPPSARKIVPIVLEIAGKPERVVDLGGGTGTWCKAFREHGVARVLCIDDERIDRSQLLVRPDEFLGADLSKAIPEPVPSDLAVCLEVVEHLPPALSERAVDFLTRSAGLVLFSAAIPGQPDERHINEQPPSFWKRLFELRGFQRLDVVRPRILSDASISYWYRQNLFLFADAKSLARVNAPRPAFDSIPDDFELLHSGVLATYRAALRPPSVSRTLHEARAAFGRALARRTRRLSE